MKLFFRISGLVFITLFTAVWPSRQGFTQTITVHGRFVEDSVKIGEPVAFTLAARYPSHELVLFPDSLFDYAPFDFDSKKIFPTVTTGATSYDSAVYYLTTFEIDRVQTVKLPVFRVAGRDSTTYYSNADSVRIRQMVKTIPDTVGIAALPLKSDTRYHPVNTLFNYPLVTIIAVGIVVLLIAVWIIFGKRIRRGFLMRRLRNSHERFIRAFNENLHEVGRSPGSRATEVTLSVWKSYMEQMESMPFTKMTSRETMALEQDSKLGDSLRQVDRAIYGSGSGTTGPLEQLRDYAVKKYHKRILKLLNGQ